MEQFLETRIEIEEKVIGILLSNPVLMTEAYNVLKPSDFSIVNYAKLYSILLEISSDQGTLDILIIENKLKTNGIYEEIGGRNKLNELINNADLGIALMPYIEILKTYSIQKKLSNICSEILTEIKEPEKYGYKKLIDLAQKKMMDLDVENNDNSVIRIGEVFKNNTNKYLSLSQNLSLDSRVSTGFVEFDRMTGGLNNSDLIILAARPAMGKTAFALNIATNVAMSGKSVLMFSLEMGNEQLQTRVLSNVANVPLNKLKNSNLNSIDIKKIADSSETMESLNLFLSEKAGVSILEIKNIARRLKIQQDYDLIVVDYLQLINSTGRSGNREQEVSEISRSLKNLARELDVPIIALSQLSRAVENRSDKRPMLSDLRESGSIEQDADIVMFLFREQYYKNLKDSEQNKDIESEVAELIIAKHRNGETGTVFLGVDFAYQRFINVVTKTT